MIRLFKRCRYETFRSISSRQRALLHRKRPIIYIFIFLCAAITGTSILHVHRSHSRVGLLQRTVDSRTEPPVHHGAANGSTTRIPTPPPPSRHVIGQMRMSGGRLGNEMFIYASVLGIAAKNNMRPVYHSHKLLQTFKITSRQRMRSSKYRSNAVMLEHSAFKYDIRFDELCRTTDGDVTIVGFFQSWKYFRDIRSRVLSEFQFLSPVCEVADNFLRDIASKLRLADSVAVQYIGVHIRRGDMLEGYNEEKGYTVADDDYLIKAVSYINRQFAPSTRLVYVVCSDEMDWAKIHFTAAVSQAAKFTPTSSNLSDSGVFGWLYDQISRFALRNATAQSANSVEVVYSEGHTTEEDLAILSSCNHTIMTVGTFGWWAGYLAGGITVYYRNFPARKSQLEMFFSREDFFPESWVGL